MELRYSVLNEEQDVRDVKIYRLTLITSEWEGAPLSAIPILLKNQTKIQLLGVISNTYSQHQKRLIRSGTLVCL